MNKARRKRLGQIVEELEEVISEEEEAFEGMPESLQGTEKGEAMEENISVLESAKDEIETLAMDC